MPTTTAALITGLVSLVVALVALAGTFLKERFTASRADADQARQADELMSAYRNPLARSTQDLQSRLWNMHRGFRGGRDREYFRNNTLYVVAELLGWLEIVRQEIQFLDAGERTVQVQHATAHLQDRLASTSRGDHDSSFYLYRGQQRAIGELMIVMREGGRPGPTRECLGYAAFVARLDDPAFATWLDRFGAALESLESLDAMPRRLVDIQHAAVDLLDILDPDGSRCPGPRTKIVEGRRE